MSARAWLLVAALAGAACSSPEFGDGHLQCASAGRACPEGFYCAGADNHCWRDGSGPDLGGGGDLGGGDLGATASRCPGLGVKLCDGFEAAALDAQWQKSLASGEITLDPTRAYRGQSSLHLHTDAIGGGLTFADASIFTSAPLPISGTAYARLWLYLRGPQPVSTPPSPQATPPGQHQAFGPAPAMPQPPAQGAPPLATPARPPGTPDCAHLPPAMGAQDAWIDEIIVDNKPIACSD